PGQDEVSRHAHGRAHDKADHQQRRVLLEQLDGVDRGDARGGRRPVGGGRGSLTGRGRGPLGGDGGHGRSSCGRGGGRGPGGGSPAVGRAGRPGRARSCLFGLWTDGLSGRWVNNEAKRGLFGTYGEASIFFLTSSSPAPYWLFRNAPPSGFRN